MRYLLNALPGALIPSDGGVLTVEPMAAVDILEAEWTSAIGHADTAALVAGMVGKDCPANRVSVPTLGPDNDTHYLALYQGPRLPEGATQLPTGATLSFYRLKWRPLPTPAQAQACWSYGS